MTGPRGRPMVVVDPVVSIVDVDELRDALSRHTSNGGSGGEEFAWVDTSTRVDTDDRDGPSGFERGRTAAARAVAAGAPTVIACGDDATVRSCIEAVAGTSTALGVVSLGPGTLLASNLSIAPGLDAVPGAVDGEPRRIDVGEANGEVFAVVAGFGAETLLGRTDHEQQRGGFAAAMSSLRDLRRAITPVTVHVDGIQRFAGRTASVLVANCPGGPGRSSLVPDADPTDSQLDLAVLAPRHPVAWADVLWRLVTGRPQRQEHVLRCRGEWVHVRTWRPRSYELDGDPRPPSTRLDVQVWPDALVVRTPRDTTADVVTSNGSSSNGSSTTSARPTTPQTATPQTTTPQTATPQTSTARKPTARKPAARKSTARKSTAWKPAARKPTGPSSTGAATPSAGGRAATEDSGPSSN